MTRKIRANPIRTKIFTGELDNSPVGDLLLAASDKGLVAVEWKNAHNEFDNYLRRFSHSITSDPSMLNHFAEELSEYFLRKRKRFTFPIDWSLMREFQRQVLLITYRIPFGETRTYGEIAKQMGNQNFSRAVGRAQALNPMPLVIPCHRVIGTDGRLHGYGGGQGLTTKEWLLKMEGAILA
jgi:methylated-DNA-[protein]-cysteine S-methyltransferase